MSINRTYKCDLCGASVPDVVLDKSLIGLYWVDAPAHGWIRKAAREVEHHICQTCLLSLFVIAKLLPVEPK